ncbi:hypothetical protein CYY_007701 [Polysphondylium violaceum]|uniref:Response regulatory domain-containing protein n=1 Tax=Polysphondylium violaceum TaxID=133409 RepID=A0A8J4PQI8_9MYCE|nr:hypothetical protein CYY_007701 [Polysphondylium violaceum]
MLSLKDYCVNYIINILKTHCNSNSSRSNNNNNNELVSNFNQLHIDSSSKSSNEEDKLKSLQLDLLSNDILEYLLSIYKNIEKCKFNNVFLYILLDCNIQTLDLSNEDNIDYSTLNFNNRKSVNSLLVLKISNLNNDSYNSNNSNSLTSTSSTTIGDDLFFINLIQPFQYLNELNLSYCTYLDGSCFKVLLNNLLNSLNILNLRGCSLFNSENLKYIGKLKLLKQIILSKTKIEAKDLNYLIDCKQLLVLKLNHCHGITRESLSYISKIESLQQLYLNHCTSLSDKDSFKSFVNSKIKLLDISYCFINDDSIGNISLNNSTQDQDNQQQQKPQFTNDLLKLQNLTSLSIRYNQLTPSFLKGLSNEKVLLSKYKKIDLRQSNFINVESCLCLYPYLCERDSELYISSNSNSRRYKLMDNKSSKVDLQELYNSYNNTTINSENQMALNKSSLRISIIEKQQHTPLILLGEDEKFQASIVKNVLERKNFDVRIATNGKTAFEMFCETPFFVLVIMDIYMPIVNGLSSIKMIRQFEKSNNRQRTPIIICSGNDQVIKSNQQHEETGGDAFISKPFRPNLVDLIIKMTSSKLAYLQAK